MKEEIIKLGVIPEGMLSLYLYFFDEERGWQHVGCL